jgi:alpha-tubulin suppressor-like RCC1 family protein
MLKRLLCLSLLSLAVSAPAAAKPLLGRLAVGTFTTCALDGGSGKVQCWGLNWMGAAGQGNQSPIAAPGEVKLPEKAKFIAGGDHKFCAVGQSGKVYCWGSTFQFAFSDADKKKLAQKCPESDFAKKKGFGTPCAPTPLQVAGITKAESIVMSSSMACAFAKSGPGACWGMNEATEYKIKGGPTVAAPKLTGLVQASASRASMNAPPQGCGAKSNGEVMCWGGAVTKDFATVSGVKDATGAWYAGMDGTYVTHKNGKVSFIGVGMKKEGAPKSIPRNSNSMVQSDKLVEVKELKDYVQIVETPRQGCGLTSGGKVACWGERGDPKIFTYTKTNTPTVPVEVPGISNAVAMGMGHNHGCALLSDGTVSCWGDNSNGQNGDAKSKGGSASKVPGVKVKI